MVLQTVMDSIRTHDTLSHEHDCCTSLILNNNINYRMTDPVNILLITISLYYS